MKIEQKTKTNKKEKKKDHAERQMKVIIGIVCEYNPFHAGHAYHIRESRRLALLNREMGLPASTCDTGSAAADASPSQKEEAPLVICVMSGDFVQRGEWAILPKHERAESAVRGGADLVVELPLPWSLSSAEGFAAGAVDLLLGLGITALSFGSESGDIAGLKKAAEMLSEPGFPKKVSDYLRSARDLPYPEARAAVLRSLGGPAELLECPNDLLGVEYLKALLARSGVNFRGEKVRPFCVKRMGCGHDELSADVREQAPSDRQSSDPVYPSAMELRRLMRSRGVGADDAALDLAAVSRLRMLCLSGLSNEGDSANGAAERIRLGIRSGARTVNEVCAAAKTKSLNYSRLKRIVMREVLGLGEEFSEAAPPYARILAGNDRGKKYLASLRKASGCVPVITQPKKILKMDEYSRKVFACGAYAKDFYNLGFQNDPPVLCGEDYRTGPNFVSACEI